MFPSNAFSRVILLATIGGMTAATSAEMTVNLGGRIHLDAAFYDEDVTELGSGTEFRRLRLFAAGDIDEAWTYKVQLDFADGDVAIKDAFISYSGLSFGKLKIGNFKAPFSLEELDSSKYNTFMERGMINAFAPSRRVGIGLANVRGTNTFNVAVFGDSPSDNGGDEGVGVAARYTTAPKLTEHSFVHLGAAVSFEEPTETGSDGGVRFRARPESHVTSQRLINGGTIMDVSNITKLGLEAAYVSGGFSAQAEYINTSIDADGGDVDYDGYYVYASYFPWGGARPYKNGLFGRVKASNTWEFALRYSNLDLTDTNGGEQNNITLAANYYVNPHLRFMANYIMADVEGGINGDEEPSIFQVRVSMDFK